MRHFLFYSALRLLLLVATGGLAYALGMRGMLLLLVAFLVSGIISFVVLRSPREHLGRDIGGYFSRINSRIDAATRAEDPQPDAASRAQEPQPDAATRAEDPPPSADTTHRHAAP